MVIVNYYLQIMDVNMVGEKTYSTSDVAMIFQVKKSVVIGLVEDAVILPIRDARGRGTARAYNFDDLIQIAISLILKDFDMSNERIKNILNQIRIPTNDNKHWRLREEILYADFIKLANGKIREGSRRGISDTITSPGNYLDERIRDITSLKEDNIKKSDLLFYFLLDMRNITDYVNNAISARL